MWQRFVRALRSIFSGIIGSIEDPKLILEQNIRELNDQVPKMNENIATVKAHVKRVEKEVSRYDRAIKEYTAKIKSAINAGRDDIAENYAMQLEKNKEHLISSREQLVSAERAYEKALQVKKAFMREKDQKIRDAREALRASERAAWQAKIADTLEQFEIGGSDQTHDEMIMRINEETAKNEARMELAMDSIDTQAMEIEVDAERMRASEIVKQFKMEMNEDQPASESSAKSRIALDDDVEEDADGGKTIGRQKTQS